MKAHALPRSPRRRFRRLLSSLLAALLSAPLTAPAAGGPRAIPRPLPDHPGHIFVAGDEITVPLQPGNADQWQVSDYEGRVVAMGPANAAQARIGRLPPGYYELARPGEPAGAKVSLGVLARLGAPTPRSSPIGIDVAMAWFYPKEKMESVANLCALAGLNWVRDRLNWAELEPQRNQFAAHTRYDLSAQAQASAGLQVLQVGHHSPAWANPNGKRFPLDLRDTYRLHRELARRWRGQVVAFEPWNEADIDMFGGHTGSEMASFQKAAYLGLKAGNPKVIAGLNVFATHRLATLRDLDANQAWPYFDTYNLHHYQPFAAYPKLYADHRAVSAGRPLWVTECSLPVPWRGDAQRKEPSWDDLKRQSGRVVKTYALALHQRAEAVFYFMLPHYTEGQTQFGVLRPDLTPRPAFLAVAAAGHWLADAKPLGRLAHANEKVHAYLFDAKPDGQRAQVLVAWADQDATAELPPTLELAKLPPACFDHLGRALKLASKRLPLHSAPLFALMPKGTRLPLLPPPASPRRQPGKPSPVVLQAVMPEQSTVLGESAYKLPPEPGVERRGFRGMEIPICLYNFGERKVTGRLNVAVALASGTPGAAVWAREMADRLEIPSGERKELSLLLVHPGQNERTATVRITGDFGSAGKPVLSLQFIRPSDSR